LPFLKTHGASSKGPRFNTQRGLIDDRADKTDKKPKDYKAFFSGPGLISEHKDELRMLIKDTMVEGNAELSVFSADLTKVTERLSTTDGRISSLQSKFDQLQTSEASPPSGN